MRNTLHILLCTIAVAILSSCHGYDDFDNSIEGNFDAVWKVLDERYCFFDEKDIDWEEIGATYRSQLKPDMSAVELFDLCGRMVKELRDGHCTLISAFDICYYQEWWTAYPQDFNLRTLQQYYLKFDYHTTSGLIYKVLDGDIGYLRYPSFSNKVGEGNLDYVLGYLGECRGLIIDIRDNGGGELSNIRTFVGRFIDAPIVGGYIYHKTGVGHSDFSEPYPVEYKPALEGRVKWDKPIVVLTNRSCYSAANDFVAVMKELPNVRIAGARTGGGGGIPFTYDLPAGWKLRLSASPMTDAHGKSIEAGIDPSEGCAVTAPAEELAIGRDAIMDFAIALLKK